MRFHLSLPLLALLLGLSLLAPSVASAKPGRTTVCGADGCRYSPVTLSGVSTRGEALRPKHGRYFVIRMRIPGEPMCLIYERSKGLVRALDGSLRATLGSGWRKLMADTRPFYEQATAKRTGFSSPTTALSARKACG